MTQNAPFQRLILNHLTSYTTAIYADDHRLTYQDVFVLTSRFCSWLRTQHVRRGQVIAIALFDSVEFVVAFLSCIRLGLIASPVDAQSNRADWDHLLAAIQPDRILATEQVCRTLKDPRVLKIAEDDSSDYFFSLLCDSAQSEVIESVDRSDPALILSTSGSTGTPKGVLHTSESLTVDTYARTVLQMTAQDVVLSCSRLSTSFALNSSLLFPLQCGAGTILSRATPNPASLQRLLALRPTLFFAVPSMYEMLLAWHGPLREPMQCVRLCVAAGDKLYADVSSRWEDAYGLSLLEGFGASEMKHIFISNRPGDITPNSCGTVVEGFEVAFHEDGTMRYRGPSLARGYYADEALTKTRFIDGWFESDDLGSMDATGHIFIHGRKNLISKSRGRWVSVLQVEDTLRNCELLSEVAVQPTRMGLEYYVTLRHGDPGPKAEQSIRRYSIQHLQTHELPTAIHFVDALPRTRGGKIDRMSLGSSGNHDIPETLEA